MTRRAPEDREDRGPADAPAPRDAARGGPGPAEGGEERWGLIRDLASFSLKAAVEAVRDVVLIPLAIAAGALGLLLQPRDPAGLFRQVVRAGRRFDDWLNLFGDLVTAPDAARDPGPGDGRGGADVLLARIERVLVDEHRRGGITTQAKDAVDRALDAVGRLPRAGDDAGPPETRRGG